MSVIANSGNGVFWTFGGLMLLHALTILGGGAIVGYLGPVEIALGGGFLVLGMLSWYYPIWIERKIRDVEQVFEDENLECPPRNKIS